MSIQAIAASSVVCLAALMLTASAGADDPALDQGQDATVKLPNADTELELLPPTERILRWKGERIILLRNSLDFLDYVWVGCKQETVPADKYAGRTGVIIEAKATEEHSQLKFQLTVALDDSDETLPICSDKHLGFFALLEYAKSLEGMSFWAKGEMKLSQDCTSFAAWNSGTTKPQNCSKMTVTRAEWGHSESPIVLYFRTESGEEGCLPLRSVNGYLLRRYWLSSFSAGHQEDDHPFDFYLSDPREQFPGWSDEIWTLIGKGMVAIGMNLDMARLACGGTLEEAGAVIAESGESSMIYACDLQGGTRFLVERDKVTKYVDELWR